MKKRVLFLAVVMLFILSCVGFAKQLTPQECTLGGIAMYMTPEQVIAMYGEPTSKKGTFASGEHGYIYYGDTTEIEIVNGREVWNVMSIGNNGWKLPSGITVGSRFKELVDLYGEPSMLGKGHFGHYYIWRARNGIRSVSIVATIDGYRANGSNVGDDEKITSLQVSCNSGNGEFKK